MVLNDLADSFCNSQKNAGLKGLTRSSLPMALALQVIEMSSLCPQLLTPQPSCEQAPSVFSLPTH